MVPTRQQEKVKNQRGAALLTVLFVCVAAAVVLQAAYATLLCAQRAVGDEANGRQRYREKAEILSVLSQEVLTDWTPVPWHPVASGEGTLEALADQNPWVLRAGARQEPSLSVGSIWAYVERGKDGLNLPEAALVADTVTAAEGRTVPWVERDNQVVHSGAEDSSSQEPPWSCYLCEVPVNLLLGPGGKVQSMAAAWGLDEGWRAWAAALASPTPAALTQPESAPPFLAPGEGVLVLNTPSGATKGLPPTTAGGTPEHPLLVVMTGSGTLHLKNLGSLYGVVVADGGAVYLEGTSLHGAVFATKAVDLGCTGQVLFAPDLLRWATDCSLSRVRLVPGTRSEEAQ